MEFSMRRLLQRCVVALSLLAFAGLACARPVPMLWIASKGEARVHLLGSFHMLKPQDYPMDPSIELAYAEAEQLVFELDPKEMTSPDLASGLMKAARFDDGQTLRGVLPEDLRLKLESFMGEAAVLGSDGMKPWFITLNLTVSMVVQAGFNPALGMDSHFMQRAADDGKPSSGLETVADQIHALSASPLHEQVIGLSEALKPTDEMRAKFDELYGFWRSGDVVAIERLMIGDMMEKTPITAKTINEDRNRRWLPQIEAMLERGDNTLVIVGALHLVGDIGLVELLRARGYSVERVAATSP
jgi:uncharacterized protein YbaP (TraB family)